MPIVKLSNPEKFRYDKGENRRKHLWNKPYAGVVLEHGHDVGKCPKGVTIDECQLLLNTGVAVYDDADAIPDFPSEVWILKDGVVYFATPSELGRCFHAYPVRDIDSVEVFELLVLDAKRTGSEHAFKRWMKSDYDHY